MSIQINLHEVETAKIKHYDDFSTINLKCKEDIEVTIFIQHPIDIQKLKDIAALINELITLKEGVS